MKHSKVLLSGILFAAVTHAPKRRTVAGAPCRIRKQVCSRDLIYEFGNVVQKISFKKTGNPEMV